MIELKKDEIDKFIDEIIEWKTVSKKDWDEIKKKLFYVDSIGKLRDQDEKSYQYYASLLIEKAKKKLEKESEIKGLAPKHENWFLTSTMKDGRYWHNFEKLMNFDGWNEERLEINKLQTFEIVNCLTDPNKTVISEEARTKKGLVYGNVQSGKTAHIASLISMYASAGCRMFIVLSGVTNNLRLQTQDRLRHDLGIDTTGGYDLLTSDNDLIGKSLQQIQGKWQNDSSVIGIFKKNPAALKRLIDYLQNVNDKSFWKGKQILIIDDECDQYSVNVKDMTKLVSVDEETGEEFDRSTINKLIIKMMHIFDRYAYVGFTATPFANILNEAPGENSLYPSDFIYPLLESDKYYGAKKIFGSIEEDPDNPLPILNVINLVDTEELNPKTADYSELPISLRKALLYFVVATAVKYKRGINKHSSFLINVDMKIITHLDVQRIVNQFIYDLKLDATPFLAEMEEIWEEEKYKNRFVIIKELFNYEKDAEKFYSIPLIEDIINEINIVLEKIEVVVDNSAIPKAARLKYDNEEDKTNVFVVIGGNTLSRGLTLEGLLVSYFYRTTALYDTLLQMGRWFGYRIHHEDLPRIWTTSKIAMNFSILAQVEDELRDEFCQYGFGITPNDIAPRIRTFPGLQITRKLAMQGAKANLINFCGYRPQTLFFPRQNSVWLKHNLEITKDFLNSLKTNPSLKNGFYIYENVTIEFVRRYIQEMNIDDRNSSFQKEPILKFIDKARETNFLKNWNIAVAGNKKGVAFDICDNLSINLLERSRIDLKSTVDDEIYLKSITGPEDMLVDTTFYGKQKENISISARFILRKKYFDNLNQATPGLLIIYPINKDSKPMNKTSGRIPLEASEHIIGITLVFPKESRKELNQYMTIKLSEGL